MSNVFVAYTKRIRVPVCALRFLFNGERIEDSKTAEEVGLAASDQIDCITHSFFPNCILINSLTYCANCSKEGEPFTLKMCQGCRKAHYCNDDCQMADREDHTHQCKQDAQDLQEWMSDLLSTKDHDAEEKSKDTDDGDDNDDDELLF